MGLPPWENSDGQLFALITGANSGLGFSIAARMIEEFITTPSTPRSKHLILILCTRAPLKTRFTISRLRAHLRLLVEQSPFAKKQRAEAAAQGREYKWENEVQRVHLLGVEVDLTDLKSVYALADRLVNGTVGSPDATTMDGQRLPHGSPGTSSYSQDATQDRWALSQKPGSTGAARSWGWGLSGVKIPRLDVVILTAGIGGWAGVDFLVAIPEILLNLIEAVTWPKYKVSRVGMVAKRQSSCKKADSSDEEKHPLISALEKKEEPPLGEVFCSNVFGHYILSHELMPLLSKAESTSSSYGGRILWTTSIEPLSHHFDINDIQGIKCRDSYESSKRLIDLLALTSELPSVKRISAPYFDPTNTATLKNSSPSEEEEASLKLSPKKPTVHLWHPGIFVSEIMPLNFILVAIYTGIFYIVRWLGSPWHTITPDKAAVAPAWLSLLDHEELERLENYGLARHKWGSAVNQSGQERVKKTEVPGWGWNGKVAGADGKGEVEGLREQLTGRRRDAVDLTKEEQENFEILGGKCWAEMEALRKEWEGILGVRK